jgi:hypothetical protein
MQAVQNQCRVQGQQTVQLLLTHETLCLFRNPKPSAEGTKQRLAHTVAQAAQQHIKLHVVLRAPGQNTMHICNID